MRNFFSFMGALAAISMLAGIAARSEEAAAAERIHYIAAEKAEWNYAPSGRDLMMGMDFHGEQDVFVKSGPGRVGATHVKVRYVAYENGNFKKRADVLEKWKHLGLLGPVIHAEVGDTIKVVFRNMADRPYSIHPHGVFYTKAHEGTPYTDGTGDKDKEDDAVAPGQTYTYVWRVPEKAGPGPSDPSSIGWLYHSHVDEIADTNAGLVGAIIVTAKGKANPDGTPKDVDREFVNLFTIFDENKSGYLEESVKRFAQPGEADKEEFEESNKKHAINGYLYSNLPAMRVAKESRVRWYLLSLGSEADIHTPHWHGETVLVGGHRVDVVNLMPASSKTADMKAENPGVWMYHCHVNDHITAGMTALYEITP